MSNIHRSLEGKGLLFTVLTTVAVAVGGLVEIVPLLTLDGQIPSIPEVTPYTPLEVAGRDIYVREGCYNCHSQMVRPFRTETERYGPYSRAGEFIYDHPFQWGSKRTGPDLHRVGGKYPDSWHYEHLRDPRVIQRGSVMPAYPWLLTDKVELEDIPSHMKALRTVGVPYSDKEISEAPATARKQGEEIASRMKTAGIDTPPDAEVVALTAYLQRLGSDIGWRKEAVNASGSK